MTLLEKHPRHRDLTGKKINRFTLLEFVGMSPKRWGAMYKVQCDCGTVIDNYCVCNILRKSNPVISCGCFNREQSSVAQKWRRAGPRVTKRYCFSLFKYACKKKERAGIKCDVWTFDQWLALCTSPCHYCGRIDVRNVATARKSENGPYSRYSPEEIAEYNFSVNSPDRLDSKLGYTFANSVSCCAQCNRAKLDYTEQEFLEMVRLICKHRGLNA